MGLLEERLADAESAQKRLVLSHLRNPDRAKTLKELKRLHVHLIRTGLGHNSSFAIGNFVARCAVLGLMGYAGKVFDQMHQPPNSFVWNNMMRGFQQNRQPDTSLLFFIRMRAAPVAPDRFTFLNAIKACSDMRDLRTGRWVHGQLVKSSGRIRSDVCVGTGLIDFYSVCKDIQSSRHVFDELPVRDAVSWTVIISVYVNGSGGDMASARRLFDDMPVKDLVARSTMIGGYVRFGDMETARELFSKAPTKDLLICNVMLGGYAKSGQLDDLIQLFEDMSYRDVVSWNTVISGLVQSKRIDDAMALFHQMQLEKNLRPNEVTFVSILSGCAQVGALDIGRWIHSYIDRNRIELDAVVGTALVNMYSKCGVLESAMDVFNQMVSRDVTAWNAMIMGFSINGQSENALKFYYQMRRVNLNLKPNEVTMVGVLSACAHAGLVDEGRGIFNSMHQELDIVPKIEHYGCMVDLLGRSGLLDEAYEFIKLMPLVPHTGVWGALLGACKIHGDIEMAECAIKHLMELDLEDGGYLAIMSNIYASAGRWNDVNRVREFMKDRRIDKMPGCSSIEVNGVVHEFGVGDKIHPRYKEIYEMIDGILRQLMRDRCVLITEEIFLDVEG